MHSSIPNSIPDVFHRTEDEKTVKDIMDNYRYSIYNGVLKVMPKVGISTPPVI